MLFTPAGAGSTGSCDFGAILENVKKVAEIIALLIGGLWAYYKFFRGRTFKSRLELVVSGTAHCREVSTDLVASVQIKNVGLSKLAISQKGSALSILCSLPTKEESPALVQWQQLMVLPVFEKHGWIEPGETIKDQLLLKLSQTESTALKLDLRIVANKIEWNEVSIIPVVTEMKSGA